LQKKECTVGDLSEQRVFIDPATLSSRLNKRLAMIASAREFSAPYGGDIQK
jgi:hypothetical protein